METPGVINSKVLLWLRKATALTELIADRSLTVSHQAQTTTEHLRVKQKQAGDKRGNKGSDTVLYVLQTALCRKLQENV